MPLVISEVFNYTSILNLALKYYIKDYIFDRVAHVHHISHLHNNFCGEREGE